MTGGLKHYTTLCGAALKTWVGWIAALTPAALVHASAGASDRQGCWAQGPFFCGEGDKGGGVPKHIAMWL